MVNQIQEIEIRNLWGKYNYKWLLDPEINILAGLNGSGKTTLLQIIDAVFTSEPKRLKAFGVEGEIKGTDFVFSFNKDKPIMVWEKRNYANISTFDIPLRDRRPFKNRASYLDNELEALIYQRQSGVYSFTDFRLKATSRPEMAEAINNRIRIFFDVINNLFDRTDKKIDIDPQTNTLQIYRDQEILPFTLLSSGEKQLLIILFKVFLMEEQPSILLMDEPENSLHIDWQQQLIDVIRKLNPQCQLIISTHSPSIFGAGWGDKLFFLEDMLLD
jgi:predicted ATP-dependent endonuclease of OLD family